MNHLTDKIEVEFTDDNLESEWIFFSKDKTQFYLLKDDDGRRIPVLLKLGNYKETVITLDNTSGIYVLQENNCIKLRLEIIHVPVTITVIKC